MPRRCTGKRGILGISMIHPQEKKCQIATGSQLIYEDGGEKNTRQKHEHFNLCIISKQPGSIKDNCISAVTLLVFYWYSITLRPQMPSKSPCRQGQPRTTETYLPVPPQYQDQSELPHPETLLILYTVEGIQIDTRDKKSQTVMKWQFILFNQHQLSSDDVGSEISFLKIQ